MNTMSKSSDSLAQPAPIGHNQGPPLDPFEAIRTEIEDLYLEAANWCDGAAIESQPQADAVGELVNRIRQARDRADELRKLENEPFDTGKAAVQARYAPLISDTKSTRGRAVLALETCKQALAPWLARIEAEQAAAAKAARDAAEAKQRDAQAAMRAAQAAADLEARERAEELVQEAKRANRDAGRAERDTARAKGTTGKAVGLTSVWTPVLTDPVAAGRHFWLTRRAEIEGLFVTLAERDVRAGKRSIPGFEIKEERVAR